MIFRLPKASSSAKVVMVRSLALWLCVALYAGASEPEGTKRKAPKLPTMVAAESLYGLVVFGTNSNHPVWAVFDKSAKKTPHYDVLYLDANADGDLTQSGERFSGKTKGDGENTAITFEFPHFKEPGSGREHKDLMITWRPLRVSVNVKWLGDKKMNAGYGTEIDNYGKFATSAEKAPVYVLGHELPFQFQPWLSGKFTRGQDNDFKVFMGNLGEGQGAFCAVDDKFLPPQDYVIATLIYKDKSGAEKQEKFDLKKRC